ncbi:MAG: cell division protein FtsZ [Flavobacteriales bacterium]|nr:cell division protein FtsZ [Flavobacteriales bacterium]
MENNFTPQEQPSDKPAMRFSLNRPKGASIKVIGVGGGGSNAVNYMFEQGIKGVDFIVCNTDNQALAASNVPNRIQLGTTLTSGEGAGSQPEIGQNAAIENLEDVMTCIGEGTNMVFITAGMGGGTGTGAAPIIARACKEEGILTVGIITVPFGFEGRRRAQQADAGLEEMRNAVDTLLVIRNEKLRELFGNLTLRKAFSNADEVLCTAAKGIAEVMTHTGDINVDMNDVKTVMKDSGVAIMGAGSASGQARALAAVTDAMESPLLNDSDITGANFVLLNISHGTEEVLMDEITEITDHIQACAGQEAEVIWGYGQNDDLGDELCVTVIATGFEVKKNAVESPTEKKLMLEDTEHPKAIVELMTSPLSGEDPDQNLDDACDSAVEGRDSQGEEIHLKGDGHAERASEGLSADNVSLKHTADDVTDANAEPSSAVVHDLFDNIPNDGLPADGLVIKTDDQSVVAGEEAEDDFTMFDITDEVQTDHVPDDEHGITFTDEVSDEQTVNENIDHPKADTNDQIQDVSESTELGDPNESTPPSVEATMSQPPANQAAVTPISPENAQLLNEERLKRIKESTAMLRTPSGLSKLEDEPAYKRRNVDLQHVPHSSKSEATRLSVDLDDENGPELRSNNPFLHDNVD